MMKCKNIEMGMNKKNKVYWTKRMLKCLKDARQLKIILKKN